MSIETLKYRVDGMTCDHCKTAVNSEIAKVAGVEAVDVDLDRIGTGTDVAFEASDLTLVSGDLRYAADPIRFSRATLRTIKQNLPGAFGYNGAALPLAALGLLIPLIAGAAMGFSSVSVVANTLRPRRFRARHTRATTAPVSVSAPMREAITA